MSIPTGGLAALLVVAMLAVTGCGSDDGTATATTVVTVPATGARTTTQQQTTTATAPSTTTQTTPSTTTQKTQTTPAAAATPKPASKPAQTRLCESIGVGLRDGDVDTTYARITQLNKITCAGAATIVAQWGQQQIGIDKALLPIGWSCNSSNVCHGGNRSVKFVLEYPQD